MVALATYCPAELTFKGMSTFPCSYTYYTHFMIYWIAVIAPSQDYYIQLLLRINHHSKFTLLIVLHSSSTYLDNSINHLVLEVKSTSYTYCPFNKSSTSYTYCINALDFLSNYVNKSSPNFQQNVASYSCDSTCAWVIKLQWGDQNYAFSAYNSSKEVLKM